MGPPSSKYKMISIPEAQATVLAHAPALGAEEVPLAEALGRVLAETVTAVDSLPPFPASIKVAVCVLVDRWEAMWCVCGGAGTAADDDTQHVTMTHKHNNNKNQKDGYAVLASDGVGDFDVVGESRAGSMDDVAGRDARAGLVVALHARGEALKRVARPLFFCV